MSVSNGYHTLFVTFEQKNIFITRTTELHENSSDGRYVYKRWWGITSQPVYGFTP